MQGTVNRVNNNGKAYSAEIDGQWYGAGFNPVSFKEGDVLEFEIEQRGQFKNLKNPRVVQGGVSEVSNAPAPAQAARPAKGGVDPQVWVDKDTSILYQSSHKDALVFVGMLLQNGAVSLPTKKADQADAVNALVEDYSAQFFIKTRGVVAQGGCTLEDTLPEFS